MVAACEAFRERHNLPGVAAALVRGGEVLFAGGFGQANLEHGVPVTADTPFEIASITKLFTAQAVLLLVHEGLVDLDRPLADYLELPSAWRAVTVRHALAHQSGIHSYTEVESYWARTRDDRTPEEILALISGLPLDFEPGERNAYDNTGFYLLGLLIETVSGQSYGAFLERRILAPAGMNAIRINDYAAVVPGRAAGYSRPDDRVENKAFYSVANTFAAGALLASAHDLASWLTRLPSQPLEQLWAPHPSRQANERRSNFTMGLGWFLVDFDGRHYTGHNGSTQGFASSLLHRPETGVSAVTLFNGDWLAEPHQLPLELIALV